MEASGKLVEASMKYGMYNDVSDVPAVCQSEIYNLFMLVSFTCYHCQKLVPSPRHTDPLKGQASGNGSR